MNIRDGRMWCWAPGPEVSGLQGISGEICEICSDNEECMVGILWGKISDLKELYEKWREKARGAEDEYDRIRNHTLEFCADELETTILVSAKKEGETKNEG